jgi:hypothetical protein
VLTLSAYVKAVVLLATAIVGCALPFVSRPPLSSAPCLGPDSYSDYHIRNLQDIASTTEPYLVEWRERVRLPVVPASEIAFVSDSATCARGVVAYNARANLEGEIATRVYVLRMGDLYVISNPQYKTGEWVAHFVFDRSFVSRSVYLY